MQRGAGVGGRKTGARTPTAQRGLSAAATLAFLNGFEQDPTNIHHCFLVFLSGTGSHIEFAVTYSKQMTAPFLTGARIGTKRLGSRTVFHPVSSEHFSTCGRISLQDGIGQTRLVTGRPRMRALVGRP
jgi:hypothetical protein